MRRAGSGKTHLPQLLTKVVIYLAALSHDRLAFLIKDAAQY